MSDITRPIIGIENRTAQEVFDIMCDRFRASSPNIGEVEVREPTDEMVERACLGYWPLMDGKWRGRSATLPLAVCIALIKSLLEEQL